MKFKISKRYSLSHLGEGWKECYIDFHPIPISELTQNDDISKLTQIDKDDVNAVKKGTVTTIRLLQKYFLGGKAIDFESGKVIDIKKQDLEEFPVHVMQGLIGFLSEAPVKDK